ncbi:MAG: GAF domain-containing protein [Dolichospermum sp.]|jgi:GAF domain-containing protein|uniref:GAF domain-containing protein n=1 Tax=unclassified Microcystis TaxID=2643300 RepID=UPI00258B9B2A|nr:MULTISPECIES: GAF domain-containing protein [unclassified Microcystis]MCA2667911.1 GAF domain-containing protein [Microcystis sp. M045S2]MCA2804115.1 GAF domain-containing protein [Microcystis sp. M114S2]MCA2836214.1 GAF domain-containing protein [Microcystis sp. M007S1]MCA2837862.1 GAF domain-containing protein [Microcystis sp. M078S1]MCA2843430.1 GAF domain-containing protein [Microcystis sp. M079S1]
MDTKILFLNLSNDDDNFSKYRQEMLGTIENLLNNDKSIELKKYKENKDEKKLFCNDLSDIDLLILWVDSEHCNDWIYFSEKIEKQSQILGFFVIFGIEEDQIEDNMEKAMMRNIYPFICPINYTNFKAYLQAVVSEIKYKKSLEKFKQDIWRTDNLDSLVNRAFEYLKRDPVGYDRASISLVDNRTEEGNRYLFRYDPQPGYDQQSGASYRADRNLQKSIEKDRLIKNVDRDTVLIIDKIQDKNKEKELDELGWTKEAATEDIISWIGLAAKYQNRTIAIITLDQTQGTPYEPSDYRLREFLKDFGRIFAQAIVEFFKKRNQEVFEEIINEMGDDLKSEVLITQILQKLKNKLGCDNCNYFSVAYDSDKKEIFLKEYASAKGIFSKKTEKSTHPFKKGVGIVGAVLEDGKSRIVPHAFEDKNFVPTLKHPGDKLSLLAVPVIPINNKNKPNRIIGVICCYKKKPDYFTVYDRDLIESIALSAATVIERTQTLEFSNEISSEMATLVVNPDKTALLRQICDYALQVTSAGSASIHLLQHLGNNQYRATGEHYTYPPGKESPPRLEGENTGTTFQAIKLNKTLEFSRENDKLVLVSSEQPDKISVTPAPEHPDVKYKLVVPLKIADEKQKYCLVGALYLNKYSEEPFSKVEKFAVELFASQAASIINDQNILLENTFRSKALEDFAEAIQNITATDNTDKLLKDVAEYSYSLVKDDLRFLGYPSCSNLEKQQETEQQWNNYVSILSELFSYVVIRNIKGEWQLKANWPMYSFTGYFDSNKSEGISREIEKRKSIAFPKLVRYSYFSSLLHEWLKPITFVPQQTEKRYNIFTYDGSEVEGENQNDGDILKKYALKDTSHSLLAVPIKDKDERIIGVICLEHSQPYAFKELHQEVIEHFARQVAIAFQKKNFVNLLSNHNKILESLHTSLDKIVRESPKNMLYKAVSETREALKAESVIVIPYKKNMICQAYFSIGEVVPTPDEDLRSFIKAFEEISSNVYSKESEQWLEPNKTTEELFKKLSISHGLCLPFSAGSSKKIGVMWILFSKSLDRDQSKKETYTYTLYANQIALAYANSMKFEELKYKSEKDLSKEIDEDHKRVRWQAGAWFLGSILASIAGFSLIGFGIYDLSKNNPGFLSSGSAAIFSGIVLEAVTVLTFNQGKAANERLDHYHKELYNTGKLNILLSATEQLEPEIALEEKRKIIQSIANSWLKSPDETNNSEKTQEVKSENTQNKT